MLRKKFSRHYKNPSQFCIDEIANEKIVTEYIKILLKEKVTANAYKEISKKIEDKDWFTRNDILNIMGYLLYDFKDDEVNVQVGKIVKVISIEYSGEDLYLRTLNKSYISKNWKTIILNAEAEWDIKTSIDVSELPFIRPF